MWRLLLLLTLVGCSTPTSAPPDVEGGVRIQPHPAYTQWVGDLLKCGSLPGNAAHIVASVQWYSATRITHGDGVTVGMQRGSSIYLLNPMSRHTVKHEVLHLLLPGHDPNHRSPLFTTCTDLI